MTAAVGQAAFDPTSPAHRADPHPLFHRMREHAPVYRPDEFDISRSPNRHLGFGHGIHFCLGAALARLQARAAVGELVRRFPGPTLAVEPADLQWTPDLFLHGVRNLPVLLR